MHGHKYVRAYKYFRCKREGVWKQNTAVDEAVCVQQIQITQGALCVFSVNVRNPRQMGPSLLTTAWRWRLVDAIWSGLNWLRTVTGGGLLCTRQWTFGLHYRSVLPAWRHRSRPQAAHTHTGGRKQKGQNIHCACAMSHSITAVKQARACALVATTIVGVINV
jgi:hypothetical protein